MPCRFPRCSSTNASITGLPQRSRRNFNQVVRSIRLCPVSVCILTWSKFNLLHISSRRSAIPSHAADDVVTESLSSCGARV